MQNSPIDILIIEDHQLVRLGLATLIAPVAQVISIYEAASMAECERLCANHSRYDMAILDLSLPDSEGFESIKRFKAASPETPFIVVSGDISTQETIAMCTAMGASGVVQKDSTGKVLHRKIKELLSKKQPPSNNDQIQDA